MNSKTLAGLVTAALVAAPFAANAASVTYDFTGSVVTPTQGGLTSAVTPGTAVSGTITFNTSNGTVTGTLGSTSGFTDSESNGTSNYVFSDSLTAGTFSYTTASPGPVTSTSNISGSNGGDTFSGFEQQNASTTGSDSGITISNSSSAAYGSNGLPLTFTSAPAGSNDTGFAQSYGPTSDVGIDYTISSLTLAGSPVPLPAAAWLMFSGLAGLVFVARRRKAGTGLVTA